MEQTDSRTKIERMYQRAMNLRDSTWQAIDFEPIETEYMHQYMRAFRVTQDVATFQRQTREYTALLRAYRKTSMKKLPFEWQIKKELGLPTRLKPGSHKVGIVNGILISVMTQKGAQDKMPHSTRPHRVMAICPGCGKIVSAGRLNQHYNRVHRKEK